MIKYITIIALLFLSSCVHTIKIEGNSHLKGCWKEGRIEVCGKAISYNAKNGVFKMEAPDGWLINIRSSEITWQK